MSESLQPGPSDQPGGDVLPALTPVGRFRIEGHLGHGGMGEVYRAWDPVLERSVAIKRLRTGNEQDTAAPERFRREALALAQLNHPNVCQVHDLVNDPLGIFIAMELVEGSTLDQVAQDLSLKEKLVVLQSVAQALEAAHAKGIVHRDLKPRNVMVHERQPGDPPRVKVVDFGLMRLLTPSAQLGRQLTPPPVPNLSALADHPGDFEDTSQMPVGVWSPDSSGPHRRVGAGSQSPSQLTQNGMFMGSPSYASPEQIQGQAVGPSSDVFSMGILAWELLAGEHPFSGEGRNRMKAIVHGTRRELRVKGLPSGTADLLKAMLETHPFKRPTAAKVAETLAQLTRPRTVLKWTALAVVSALLLAGGVNLFLGRGIISDLTRQRPARLAVLPFSNETGDPRLDSIARLILPEMMESGLRDQARLAVLDQDLLARTRKSLRLGLDGPLSPIDQGRLAAALGTQLMLRGKLLQDAKKALVLSYELIDGSGRIRHSGEAQQAGDRTAISLPLARQACNTLLKAMNPFGSIRTALPDVPASALVDYTRGTELMDRGNFKEAAPAFLAAALAAPDYAAAVLGYARCLSRLADAPPEPVYHWARWAARAQGNRITEMKALHHLAVRHGDRGQWQASAQAGREALELAKALGESAFEAGVHSTLGVNLQRQHKPLEAEAEYQQALLLFRTVGDRHSATRALNNLAVLDKERGNLKGAEARYLDALQTVQAYGDKWGECFITNNLGDLALAQEGGLDRAEAFFHKAQALRAAIGDENGMVYTLMGLATVQQARGDFTQAEALLGQFLEQARKTRLRPMEALALYNLGEVHRAAGRFPEARGYYQQSLPIHQELDDAVMEAHCLAGEAECLAREGRRGMAATLLERSRTLSAEDTPYTLRAQAWVARSEGRTDEARSLFTRALSEARIHAPEIQSELKAALR